MKVIYRPKKTKKPIDISEKTLNCRELTMKIKDIENDIKWLKRESHNHERIL